MEKTNVIQDFATLGRFLRQFGPQKIRRNANIPGNELFFESMQMLVERAHESNPWFTPENMMYALGQWGLALEEKKLRRWLDAYTFPANPRPQKVGIIMAGNIPAVGLHDLLSVLAAGHRAVAKLSSSDNKIIPLIVKYLEHINPAWKGRVEFTDGLLRNFDAVIATGSDNSARYFQYYFGRYPHIIRHNRNGVAVLTGDETDEQMEALADDILLYFGLGCRNVSKLFVPKGFDLNRIFKGLLKYAHYAEYRKYRNNYDYNKAVFLMSTDENERLGLLDNGLVLLKNDTRYASPVGVVFYETYDRLDDVRRILEHDRDKIQVVISTAGLPGALPPGQSQQPQLWDYADGVDTMRFLLDLHKTGQG